MARIEHQEQRVGLWGLLACLLGIGGCRLDRLPEQRNLAFDVSPTGDQVVFLAAGEGERDIYLLNLDSLRVTQVAQTPEFEAAPAFSPDGRWIVYAASADLEHPGHIFVRTLDGKGPKQLAADERFSDGDPSFSLDGSQITFARAHRHRPYSLGGYVWDDWDVYVMSADGANPQRITHQNYRQLVRPKYLLDQKRIVFGADVVSATGGSVHDGFNIFEVFAGGQEAPKGLTTDGDSFFPGVSRDGKRVVFSSDRAEAYNQDLYVMDADGSNVRRLTHNRADNLHPVFTRDGSLILFLSWPRGAPSFRYGLWEVDTEGRNLQQIADPRLFGSPLQWKR